MRNLVLIHLEEWFRQIYPKFCCDKSLNKKKSGDKKKGQSEDQPFSLNRV